MARTILHIDMDAFYASIEQRDDPALRGKPVVVGGHGKRGVVAAASYEVRKFGVRSAMPMVEALRRCPTAVVIGVRHGHYSAVSAKVFDIFHRFTPLVQGLSLDEAFLDVTTSLALYGDGATIAERIRAAIRAELSLTASAGVASSMFVAKIASDVNKPDGITLVEPGTERAFLSGLPVERMWGLGPKSALVARQAGLQTFDDLARADPREMEKLFGQNGPKLSALARGEDAREVEPDREAKSIGSEETFDEDITAPSELARRLLAMTVRVGERLDHERLAARRVTVKMKFNDFSIATRSMQVPHALSDTSGIYAVAKSLLSKFPRSRPVRLIGVSVGAIEAIDARPVLFPDPTRERARAVDRAAHALREKFGEQGITRAELLGLPKRRSEPDAVDSSGADEDDASQTRPNPSRGRSRA